MVEAVIIVLEATDMHANAHILTLVIHPLLEMITIIITNATPLCTSMVAATSVHHIMNRHKKLKPSVNVRHVNVRRYPSYYVH